MYRYGDAPTVKENSPEQSALIKIKFVNRKDYAVSWIKLLVEFNTAIAVDAPQMIANTINLLSNA